MSGRAPVLVVGVGNELLGDEGIGVHVARVLRARASGEEVEVLDGGTTGFELLPWFEGRERVILVDAIRTRAKAGAIYRIPAEEVAGFLPAASSAHGSDIGELIRAALALDPAPEVRIVGVVPESLERFALEPGPRLRERFEAIVEAVLDEVARPFRISPPRS